MMLMLRPKHRKHQSRRVTKRAPNSASHAGAQALRNTFSTPSRGHEVSPAVSAAPALSSGPLCASLPSTAPHNMPAPRCHAHATCHAVLHANPCYPCHATHAIPCGTPSTPPAAIAGEGNRRKPRSRPPDALGNRPPLAWATPGQSTAWLPFVSPPLTPSDRRSP